MRDRLVDDYLVDLKDEVEREVMACIGCNDCLIACPLPESSVVTIAALNAAVLSEQVPEGDVAEFVQSCTQCQQCVPVCPADLHRADMVLWNKMKMQDVAGDREMPLQVDKDIEPSGITLDGLAAALSTIPLFGGVERKGLRRMLLSATLRALVPGDVLCREGQFHERLYVLVTGAVEQSVASDRGRERILLLKPGSFHGEMAVLGNQREPFTVTAVLPSTVLELPKTTVLELMRESSAFEHTMDDVYARRALWTHARSSPLLSQLPEDEVAALLRQAQLLVLGPGDVVFNEGDSPGDVYLVRSGFLRVARRFESVERVLQYYREGDMFGASAVLFSTKQTATVSANTRAEVIRLPGRELADLVNRDEGLRGQLMEQARQAENAILGEAYRKDRPTGSSNSRLMSIEGLLDQGVIQGHEVLVINTSICTDCNNCVDACGRRWGRSRLDRRGLQLGSLLFPSACRHCEDPVCLLCSVNGIVREPDGEIRIVEDNCIGCGACAERCPYDNIIMHKREEDQAFGARLLSLVGLGSASSPETDEEADLVAVKCDLCFGKPDYACVQACPVGAAMRIDPEVAFGHREIVIGLEMKKQERE